MEYKGDLLMVRLRETGEKRHTLLGTDSLVNRRLHAALFTFQPDAIGAIEWMMENNPGHFDSGQVVKGKRVVATVTPGDGVGGTTIEWK